MRIILLVNSWMPTGPIIAQSIIESPHDLVAIIVPSKFKIKGNPFFYFFKIIRKYGVEFIMQKALCMGKARIRYYNKKISRFLFRRKMYLPDYSSIEEWTLDNSTPIYYEKDINHPYCLSLIRELAPEILVVSGIGQILKRDLLSIPRFGAINLHLGLLPKYRGSSSVFWTLHNGEKKMGVTLHYIDEGIDSGEILAQDQVEIIPDDCEDSLVRKGNFMGGRLIKEVLERIDKGKVQGKKQDENNATYYPRPDAKTRRELKRILRERRLKEGLLNK